MKMTRRRLNDVFDNWYLGEGIFYGLEDFDVPWRSSNISDKLDLEYHGNISGNKYISPLVDKIVTSTLSSTELTKLAGTIFSIFDANWNKQFETLLAEYDPVENYHINETMSNDNTIITYGKSIQTTNNLTHAKTGTEQDSPDLTDRRTDDLSHTKRGTDTETFNNVTDQRTDNLSTTKTGSEITTPNKTTTMTPTVSTQVENFVSAFNSDSYEPESKSVTTNQSGAETTTETGTETKSFNNRADTNTGTQTNVKSGSIENAYNTTEADSGTQIITKTGNSTKTYNTSDTDTGTSTDAVSGSDSTLHSYVLIKRGNMGFTTFQKMLEEEHNLWVWNFFRDVVFPDIDKILTLPIY